MEMKSSKHKIEKNQYQLNQEVKNELNYTGM